MKKSDIKILLLLLLLISAASLLFFSYKFFEIFYKTKPAYKDKIIAPFIKNKIEIYWDNLGIPHIFSRNEEDYFFALGYIHAMERLFQMEGYRLIATGKISEIIGEKGLSFDKFYKCLAFDETASLEEFILSPALRKKINSYIQGINFYLNRNKNRLYPEFHFLKLEPELWKVKDIILVLKFISWNFSYNYESKSKLWKINHKIKSKDFYSTYPNNYPMIPNAFTPASNFWAVDGTKSYSGYPIIANDTHTALSIPTIWYEIHANINGSNLLGATIPGIPFVIIGRNDKIAWGITVLPADTQDISLISKINYSSDYLRKIKKLKIKDKGDIFVETFIGKSSRIISGKCDDYFYSKPYELLWTGFVPGNNLDALYAINNARDWNAFKNALSEATSPTLNFLYADREGNIAYYPAGLIPIRLYPISYLPYNKKQEWIDFLLESEKPITKNPLSHYIFNANNKIDLNNKDNVFAIDWVAPFRAERIKKLLNSKDKFNIKDFMNFQLDVKSELAELLVPFIEEVPDNKLNLQAKKLKRYLINWDKNVDDSPEATIFEVFYNKFLKNTFKDEMGEENFKIFISYLSKEKYAGLINFIKDKTNKWFDNALTNKVENRDDIISKSLEETYSWLKNNLGENIDNWKWSLLHHTNFLHPVAKVWFLNYLYNIKDIPFIGDGMTINNSDYNLDEDYNVEALATYRFIAELDKINRTYSIMNIGQSGHPLSKHYKDQMRLWIKGKYHQWIINKKDMIKNNYPLIIFSPRLNYN